MIAFPIFLYSLDTIRHVVLPIEITDTIIFLVGIFIVHNSGMDCHRKICVENKLNMTFLSLITFKGIKY